MYRIVALLIGYFFGCLQNGYFLSRKLAGIDVREYGSGSAGMTNVMRVLGFTPGAVVLVADIFKAVAAFALASVFFSWESQAGLYAGLGVIIGHNFPFYLSFRGGKGVACTLGLILLLDWRAALIIYGIMLLIAAATRFISLASLTMSVLIPVMLLLFGHSWEAVIVTTAIGGLSVFMHRHNIKRLINKTEHKIFTPKKETTDVQLPPVSVNDEMPSPNENKVLAILAESENYLRYPVKTHVITAEDTLEVFAPYLSPYVRAGDIVFISERAVACTQSRAIPMKDIKPRPLAVFLSGYVQKTPAGIGLGIPETMEMALRECGIIRILFAAAVSVVGKKLGQKGWFYHVAGAKARGIDGPCDNTIPPYNEYVVLAPDAPGRSAQQLANIIGTPVVIVDCNDLGVNLMGASDPKMKETFIAAVLRDNPLGQSGEQTPCGIIRKESVCADFADLQATNTTIATTPL